MRLVSFSVSDYRSITTAHRLRIRDLTVLIGPNNEGKSNLLAALRTAMVFIQELSPRRMLRGRIRLSYSMREAYRWDRDYPVPFQDQYPDGESAFRLEFELTEAERAEFHKQVGSAMNGNLPVEIRLGRGDPFFRVIKQGPGSKALNAARAEVADFIQARIGFTYIPAVRTAREAISVVYDMVSRELHTLEDRPEYQRALQALTDLQAPMLQQLSARIKDSLNEFLPQVSGVSVTVSEDGRARALRRSVDIVVDDGTPTNLERKGDGMQSLAAISLMRGAQSTAAANIVAIEEPESHLHPRAVHRLRAVIQELSGSYQVILTTHSPAFVDRVHPCNNLLVADRQVTPVKSVAQVRDSLGVRAADNLRHAELVLLVEGESDRIALSALLAHASELVRHALESNTLVLDCLHGAGNLLHRLSALANALCQTHCFLDNDQAGKSAALSALSDGLIAQTDYHLATCPGLCESELEDMYKQEVFAEDFTKLGLDARRREFRGGKPWTTRLKALAKAHGKSLSEDEIEQLKINVAAAAADSPANALHSKKRSAFDSLLGEIERKLAP